jgi:hypothetical protein
MITEDIVDEIIADLASGLVDKSNDEIIAALSKYDLDPEEVNEILETVDDLREAETTVDSQSMANEDNTPVNVSEEDTDGDGDTDKVTLEKEEPEDDNNDEESDKPHDEGLAGDTTLEEDLMLEPDMSPTDYSKKAAEKRDAVKNEPAPDMFKFSPDVIGALTSHRF